MTDSNRSGWGSYFDEAERNRGAAAALGIVRNTEQNGGQSIRVLGQRRVVMAFDPDHDDPEILRTVLMLLRTVSIAASIRTGDSELATAEERITDAIEQLERIDSIKGVAGAIQKNAAKIESDCTAITTTIHRLLDQALVALAGTASGDRTPGDADRLLRCGLRRARVLKAATVNGAPSPRLSLEKLRPSRVLRSAG